MLLSYRLVWFLAGLFGATDSRYSSYFWIGSVQFSPTIFWLVAGTILCLAELTVPTAFVLFIMGISAFVVSLATIFIPIKLSIQFGIWIIFSLTFVYLSHRFIPKRKVSGIEHATEAQTLTEIPPGSFGRVLYEGNSWRARCSEQSTTIAQHTKVYIVGREGTTLIVMPENILDS